MKRLVQFIKQIVTSHSGISSKRVCGVLVWISIIGVFIYCAITSKQAPTMVDTLMISGCALLGIDSVTGIWKNFGNQDKKGDL